MKEARSGILLLCLVCCELTIAQTVVNGSFEGLSPDADALPAPWSKCTYTYNNSPDVFPGAWWGVLLPASHGSTYLNLVVKVGEPNEKAFGVIDPPMAEGECYRLLIDVAVSDQFIVDAWDLVDFTRPAGLRIRIGFAQCFNTITVLELDSLQNSGWRTHSAIITPQNTIDGIQVGSYFASLPEYYGHVLLDNIRIQHSGDTVDSQTIVVPYGTIVDLAMLEIPGFQYLWSDGSVSCQTCSSTSYLVQGNAVIYGYEVDTTSCFSAVHRFVLTTLELPNVITPNGDGQNDRLDLGPGSGCRDVTIFSRWGNEVFHTPCYGNDWNAQGLADGVYFYVVKTAVKDYEHVGRGTLTVIR